MVIRTCLRRNPHPKYHTHVVLIGGNVCPFICGMCNAVFVQLYHSCIISMQAEMKRCTDCGTIMRLANKITPDLCWSDFIDITAAH